MSTILIIDDDDQLRISFERLLTEEGYGVRTAPSGEIGLRVFGEESLDLVILDMRLPGMNGMEVFKTIHRREPKLPVIIMTAYGTTDTAIEATKLGAFDYILKPFDIPEMLNVIRQALDAGRFMRSPVAMNAVPEAMPREAIVGRSRPMQEVYKAIGRVSPTDATVLIRGESGTGKELAARAVYQHSLRADKPFLVINCVAIPENLLESELFGYEKGAFTNATSRKEGRVERAHGGTLFLDEIGELAPAVQVKLLRMLQEGEIERLGGHSPVKVDARIVAATNRDLAEQVEKGLFREDLFYRLNVITVRLPPLRARRGDVSLLAQHFVPVYAEKNRKRVTGISRGALDVLDGYSWPGNVRELQHAIERAVVLTRNEVLGPEDFEERIRGAAGAPPAADVVFRVGSQTMDELEHRVIRETLRFAKEDKALAAQLLGISVRTVYRRLDEQKAGPPAVQAAARPEGT